MLGSGRNVTPLASNVHVSTDLEDPTSVVPDYTMKIVLRKS